MNEPVPSELNDRKMMLMLSRSLVKRLKACAQKSERSMSYLTRKALDEYLTREEEKETEEKKVVVHV